MEYVFGFQYQRQGPVRTVFCMRLPYAATGTEIPVPVCRILATPCQVAKQYRTYFLRYISRNRTVTVHTRTDGDYVTRRFSLQSTGETGM